MAKKMFSSFSPNLIEMKSVQTLKNNVVRRKNNKKSECVGHYMLWLSNMNIEYCSQWGPKHWAKYDTYDKVLWDSTWNIF